MQCTNDGARSVPARPSVLLVTIDTLRADHVSAYGYARKTSPQLDALAADGALFETAYAASSATGPSHATLFTARHPLAHGVVCNGVVLDASIPTIASLLSDAGYRTAAFVSSYPVASKFGLSHGFAHYDQDFGTSGGTMKSRRWQRERGDAGALDRRGAVTVDAASAWLEQQKDGAPLLVWVHLFDPHAPYSPPAPYDASFLTADPSQHQREIDLYDGEIRYADEQLGRLVAAFDRTTGGRGLVVVTSDHGEGLWEHGYGGHNRDVWEEEVRIPLVVRWRGKVEPGRRVAEPVHLVDVLPTVVAAAGIAPPAGTSGVDLVAALTGRAELSAERLIYLTRPYFGERARKYHGGTGWGFGLRRGSWKLIEAQSEGRRNLYDLARDPEEQENRAGEEAARAAELAGLVAG
ncbi:sulfatase [Candidatus Binatia bacterium]|nr:sulfatase [Candidatus Binatia bacterium]